MSEVELHINYWNGDFYAGTFDDREQAEEFSQGKIHTLCV